MMRFLKVSITGILVILAFWATGQDNVNWEKALKEEKVTFITRILNLTSEEAKQFWPLYDQYWEEKNEILKEREDLINIKVSSLDSLSNTELKRIADKYVLNFRKEANLLVDFNSKLKEILPPKKVIRFYQSNTEFKKYLLNKIQEHEKNRQKK
ncbi:MAG: hypothetical protein H6537_03940 [Bacteroidales bacterium]|nr:hypothetical protein [Bacteroidales bacterium]HPD96169.1 hypothetical protein [Tenuifilaceae bacterium]HRX30266.1 hypothetical protein [Tenuifilaceae bacterium]